MEEPCESGVFLLGSEDSSSGSNAQASATPSSKSTLTHAVGKCLRGIGRMLLGSKTSDRSQGGGLPECDLLCGGFPCQDLSSAGKQAGIRGPKSGLWFEFLRLIHEIEPRWVVIENVLSGARLWIDQVRRDLERAGYASLPIPLRASEVGAPHPRPRCFLVAWHRRDARPIQFSDESARALEKRALSSKHAEAVPWRSMGWTGPVPEFRRVDDGISDGLDVTEATKRFQELGNCVVPQCALVAGIVVRVLDEALFGDAKKIGEEACHG